MDALPPNKCKLTTEPITYDVAHDQHQDQEQDQGNNQAVGTQNDDNMIMQAMKMGRVTMTPMIELSNQTMTIKQVLWMTLKNQLPNQMKQQQQAMVVQSNDLLGWMSTKWG